MQIRSYNLWNGVNFGSCRSLRRLRISYGDVCDRFSRTCVKDAIHAVAKLWMLWSVRNDVIWKGKVLCVNDVLRQAAWLGDLWLETYSKTNSILETNLNNADFWTPPPFHKKASADATTSHHPQTPPPSPLLTIAAFVVDHPRPVHPRVNRRRRPPSLSVSSLAVNQFSHRLLLRRRRPVHRFARPPPSTTSPTTGIICVGGDGIVNEVLNGLLCRTDQKEAISIPIGIILAGTDNSLVWTVLSVRDSISAAIAIVKEQVASQRDMFDRKWRARR
nr:sphingoid long-chain bases kinase 1-like [Ipomoea batatas]